LELGDLGVGQLDSHAVSLSEFVEAASDADDGAAPQYGGVGVPHHSGVVVVAVRAQRLAQTGVVLFVPLAAGQAPTVRAMIRLAPWSAPGNPSSASYDASVDGAEAGSGEGGEDARMDGDRLGNPLAAREPGPDELVGIGPVGLRAGRADRGAAVSAGDVDRLVRQVVGIQVPEDLAGRSVDVADGAAQPDWADAPSRGLGGTEPLLVVITGSALKQFRVEGAGARSRPRTVIDQDWGRHQAGRAHGQPLAWCCRSRGGG